MGFSGLTIEIETILAGTEGDLRYPEVSNHSVTSSILQTPMGSMGSPTF